MTSCNEFDILAATNMATMHMDHFIRKMLPEEFRRGDDLENFIEECERYFQYAKIPESKQEITIEFMLEKELRILYRKVDQKVKGYKERLRIAFQRKTTLADDVKMAFEYRQTTEEPEKYFKKIDKLVERIMSHTWTKENLTEQLLLHCSNEKSLKREICLNGTKSIENIKEKIGKLYESKTHDEEVYAVYNRKPENHARKTYSEIVREEAMIRPNRVVQDTRIPRKPYSNYNNRECWTCHEIGHSSTECQRKRNIECFNCGRKGHVKRECQEKRMFTCYGCGEKGHIRRECQKVRCQRCHLGGHKEEECYTNLNRIGQRMQHREERPVRRENYRENKSANRGQYRNNGGYVAYMNEDTDDRSNASEVYPNVRASTTGEVVGAMY